MYHSSVRKKELPILVVFSAKEQSIVKIELFEHSTFAWQLEGGDPILKEKIVCWLDEYLSAREPQVTLPLFLPPRPRFIEAVQKTLTTIPLGKTLSYEKLAQLAGNPKAARAAGTACGKNDHPLVIPCHRVLPKAGGIGGFAYGREIKRRLLWHEIGVSLK